MSFRAPKPPKRKGVSGSALQPSSYLTPASPSKTPAARHLVPPSVIPRNRRPRNSRDLYLPGPEQILTLPGQSYSQMPFSSHGRSANATSTHVPQNVGRHTGARDCSADPDDNPYRSPGAFDIINDIFVADAPKSEELQREKQRQKKEKQWKKWTQEVIPSLLRPHLRLLRKSASLRSIPQHTDYHCKCGGTSSRRLKVVCVSFEREFYILYDVSASVCWIQDMFAYILIILSVLKSIEITACRCGPAALQLLSRGLFPCAPTAPTLAVDIKMLEFVRELFVRMPPNTTAWCDTLEAFLGKRAYKLTTRVRFPTPLATFADGGIQDTLRRRFSNALQWYFSLVNATEVHIQTSLENARSFLKDSTEQDGVGGSPMDEGSLLFPVAT
jgi:CxC1 like cysteine cluster associated with KDZ transposases